MHTTRLRSSVLLLALTGCGGEEASAPARVQQQSQSDPIMIPDNPSCASLGLTSEFFKIEPPVSGEYDIDGFNSTTVTIDGLTFDWSASLGLDAVIVKGGPNANVYLYTPEHASNAGSPALHAPVNPETGLYYGISHIELCFDYEVDVWKSANTAFDRTHVWSIDKAGTVTELVLSAGQVIDVDYVVDLATTYVDSTFTVSGAVHVFNPAPFPAELTSINDVMGGVPVVLSCPVAFPHTLAPLTELACTYDAEVPDPSARMNVAEAITLGRVGSGSTSLLVDFASAEMESIDECVTVTDDRYGPLGTHCGPGPHQLAYQLALGPFECGERDYLNFASFETGDSGATGESSWSVHVDVPCDQGCTLTPGYWKTHSSYGPAPYDDTWALLPAGADTPFFLSGQSYYGVLWTVPKLNAYYILARAYIAAGLNQLNGAAFGAVAVPYAEATAILASHTPADLVGRGASVLRMQVIELAHTLDDFNNGLTGPGHCDE